MVNALWSGLLTSNMQILTVAITTSVMGVSCGSDLHHNFNRCLCVSQFDRTALDIALANGRTDIAQMLQLAQHTDIAITEGDTVTVETTDPIVMETVITADGQLRKLFEDC